MSLRSAAPLTVREADAPVRGGPGRCHAGRVALPPALAPLAFLIGTWRGDGVGGYPTVSDFAYAQEIVFGHFGKPVLCYTSRSWDPADGRPLHFETGFWRPVDTGLEVLLAHASGVVELFYGTVDGGRVELATDAVVRSRSAKEVTAEHRLYGLVGQQLMYAVDMSAVGQPLQPHLSAKLDRVPDPG